MREQKECMKYINSLKYGMNKDKVCKLRTEYCIEWYTKKAVKYKHIFIVLSVVNIAVPQISAIIVFKMQCAFVSAIFSAIVSFSAALLALLNVKDRWIRYRSVAEYIKREYTLYCVKASPYDGNDSHTVYMHMLEKYMAEEQHDWAEGQKKMDAQAESV